MAAPNYITPIDANTVALYRMSDENDTGACVDAVGALTNIAASSYVARVQTAIGRGIAIVSGDPSPNANTAFHTLLTSSAWTVDLWVDPWVLQADAGNSYVLYFGTNTWAPLALQWRLSTQNFVLNHLDGAGWHGVWAAENSAPPRSGLYHVVCRYQSNGADATMALFVNGASVGSATVPVIGSGSAASLYLGRISYSTASRFRGVVQNLRFSNVARSDAWVAAEYEAAREVGWFSVPVEPPNATKPVVTIVSPAAGAPLGVNVPIVLDVTDDAGSLRRVLLKLRYSTADTWEIAHDGAAFAPHFLAGSTQTAITNGYRYSLLRAGGWPGAPTFEGFAIDTAGNEAD